MTLMNIRPMQEGQHQLDPSRHSHSWEGWRTSNHGRVLDEEGYAEFLIRTCQSALQLHPVPEEKPLERNTRSDVGI